MAKAGLTVNWWGTWLTLALSPTEGSLHTVSGERMNKPTGEPNPELTDANVEIIPEELALEIRKMAHDLSNALEIIVQTSYLLSTAELKEPATQWLEMLESGVTKALEHQPGAQDLR